MLVQSLDEEWHLDAAEIAPIRLARFVAGFAAVVGAMALVGAMLYLAVIALAGAVSFGETVSSGAPPVGAAVASMPGVGN